MTATFFDVIFHEKLFFDASVYQKTIIKKDIYVTSGDNSSTILVYFIEHDENNKQTKKEKTSNWTNN